jgi:cytochrome c556
LSVKSIKHTGAALIALATVAAAPLVNPADQIATRVAGLRELGAAMKAVKDGIAPPEVQTILVQQAARQIVTAAGQMPGWFPAGSGPAPGLKTAAKSEIWAQPEKFAAARDTFVAEAAKFQTIARAGDAAAIRAEVPKLGATCGGCHDTFREKAK